MYANASQLTKSTWPSAPRRRHSYMPIHPSINATFNANLSVWSTHIPRQNSQIATTWITPLSSARCMWKRRKANKTEAPRGQKCIPPVNETKNAEVFAFLDLLLLVFSGSKGWYYYYLMVKNSVVDSNLKDL
jgi:hypothetical protein